MYGHKNRTLGADYCLNLMPMESITASPPPQSIPNSSSTPPPVDWILKKERIFLLAQFWQQRATLAEKEVTSLKEQLAANHGGSAAMAPPPRDDREDPVISTSQHKNQDFELAAKDKEIASLVEDVQRLQTSLNQIRESSATQIRLLEEQLEAKQEVISRLETRLDSQRDYEDMKRELSVFKGSSTPTTNSNSTSTTTTTTPTNTNNTNTEAPVNGVDAKDVKDKRPSSPMNALNHRFLLGPAAALPVEAFGSLLGEEIVATWRRSLERSLLSSSPPLHLHTSNIPSSISHHQLSNESCSPPPQQSSPNESSMNESSINMDTSFMNGSRDRDRDGDRIPYRYEDSLIPKSDPMEGRLQEMLRYNMDKFGSQCLDTLQIARRVRELLSIHNIGQRLFAKYVLGLSQGTVSELLSKPKPWDKLTEKGRDSYRKMHAWAADEASVLLLKSLIPKKGKEGTPGSLSASFRCEDSGAEDRIVHILNEANQALHRNHHSSGGGPNNNNNNNINNNNSSNNNNNLSGGNHDFMCDDNAGSKSPSSNNNGQCPPSPSSSSSRDRRLRKYENDDISQERVARLYQEELAKLVGIRIPQGSEPDPRIPRENFQSLLFPHLFGSSLLERDDIRMALDAYHRELAKLAATSSSSPSHFPPPMGFHSNVPLPNGIGGAQDLSMPRRLSPNETKDTEDKFDKEENNDVMRHVGSAFSLVRPKTESNSGAPSPLSNSILPPSSVDDSSNASPLQRMASITNSLISQPTAPSVSSPNQRPLKAVLPPITQQQFDQYNNLNTEDIVRKVKEQLSQYSISQRLFGESVLGLSQGSVSDLLARPKPWHMLTQKGREPFIRMKMFLEDENAVHKLVASQYKIAPEKLMRTGGYAGNPSPSTASKAPVSKVAELPKSLETSPLPPPPPPIPPPVISIPVQSSNIPMPHDLIKREQQQQQQQIQHQHKSSSSTRGSTTPSPNPMLGRPMSSGLPQQPSVYEMAALTQDLDTQLITTKIKEALLANNIGQKIFGEVVLGLSQGSVSELLSKPKPWHMLSIKGREPFIRMQLWLADPLNVERLQHLKNERREANKRKRGIQHSSSPLEAYISGAQGSSDASNDSPNESFSPGSAAAAPPSKKQRVLFSDEQKEALRLAFALDSYPNVSAIEFLARELGLSSRTITNWFHNHRMRLKQQTSSPLVQDTSLSSQPFDPVQFRLLLHQRLLELHKDKYQVLPFFNQQSTNSHAGGLEGGLDLTVSNTASRIHSDNDDDYFEEVEEEEEDMEGSIASDDSGASEGSKTQRRKRKSSPHHKSISSQHAELLAKSRGIISSNARSSRRKPAAPQRHIYDDSDDEHEVLINGVCVLQNPTGYSKGSPTGGVNKDSNTTTTPNTKEKERDKERGRDWEGESPSSPFTAEGKSSSFKTEPNDDDEDEDEEAQIKSDDETKEEEEEDLQNDKNDSDENNDICIKSETKLKTENDNGDQEEDEEEEVKNDTAEDTD